MLLTHAKLISIITSLYIPILVFTSCYGQDVNGAREGVVVAPESTTNDSLPEYIDSMFYIDGQLCQHLRKMHQDQRGNLWFGTNVYDIMRYDGDTLEYFSETDGAGGGRVTGIVEDDKGNVWFAMAQGLTRYDGESFTHFTAEGIISGLEVGATYEDESGNIWFAAENHGVYRYDGEQFTNFNSEDGLNTNGILSIFQDREGRFWFGGWGGLFRYDEGTFSSVTKDGPWEE